jgi:3-carboxy-cis,cis-muconate cycloisomerase
MPDQNGGPVSAGQGLFGAVFGRGPGSGPVADDAAWLRGMLAAEAGLARALERAGLVHRGAGAAVTEAAAADFGPGELAELSRAAALTGNPVPGVARVLARRVADPAARAAVHMGAASQDIMDTAAMLLARDALGAAIADLTAAAADAARLAATHRRTLMIGRTLLQQAAPVTFGLVAAGWLSGLDSAVEWLAFARDTRLAVQFGGAVGTLASLGADGARVRALLAEELGLPDPALSWHTERLRVIDVGTVSARACAALSKVARDVTLLGQTEVGEVKGNPVAAVAVLGCARQAPGLLATLVACAEQEYQRAAGAWHAEWQPYGHLLELAVSAAAWSRDLLGHLEVDTARMAANLAEAGGQPLAEGVVALLRGHLGASQAHDLVTTAAAKSAMSGVPFRDVLLATPEIENTLTKAGISQARVEAALDPSGYLGSSEAFITAALDAHARQGLFGRARGLLLADRGVADDRLGRAGRRDGADPVRAQDGERLARDPRVAGRGRVQATAAVHVLELPLAGERVHDDGLRVGRRGRGHDDLVGLPQRLVAAGREGEDGEQRDPRAWRHQVDPAEGRADPGRLPRRRHAGVIVAGLHDHH